MEINDVLPCLAALAQKTRLEAVRLLVRHEPGGLAAGEIARRLGVPQNTLSAHLVILAQAGLVEGARSGRAITYRVILARLSALTGFLLQDCCGGRPETCASFAYELKPLPIEEPGP